MGRQDGTVMPPFCISQGLGLVSLLTEESLSLSLKQVNISRSLAIYLHNRSGPELTTSSSTPHNPVSLPCVRTTPGNFFLSNPTNTEQQGCPCCPHHLKAYPRHVPVFPTNTSMLLLPHTHRLLLHIDLNDINLSSDNQPRVIELDLVHSHRSTLLLLFF